MTQTASGTQELATTELARKIGYRLYDELGLCPDAQAAIAQIILEESALDAEDIAHTIGANIHPMALLKSHYSLAALVEIAET